MQSTRTPVSIVAAFVGALVCTSTYAQDLSSEELQRRRVERRAVDAAIWGMPIVSLDAMRQAYFRDGEANYGDIIWWPEGNDRKNQSLSTPAENCAFMADENCTPEPWVANPMTPSPPCISYEI